MKSKLKVTTLLNDITNSGVDVCLISKYWDEDQLMELYELGYRKFGENRVNVLAERAMKLPSDIEWHFVGNLQSRDLGEICKHTSLIQSFDRPDLLEKLSNYPKIEILLQINLTGDKNRNGINPNDLGIIIDKINSFGIKCKGFMFHPSMEFSDEIKEDLFNKMNIIYSQFPHYSILSMGTSNDYELANRCGATMNRLGRLLFD